jgi:glycolate dehydrogenase FAD-binding subunit
MQNLDISALLQQTILEACESASPLKIVGGGSKDFYGRKTSGKVLKVNGHQGIINYQPSELVITARSGTLLTDVEERLREQRQMLAFEPPHFAATATLGGAVACGFSGPRRPFTGSVRDYVLGCKLINGKAQILTFGGEVMKNVAGYDVSRAMVGAMGTLGVLLEISLKVLPLPVSEMTCVFELRKSFACKTMCAWSAQTLPLSGLAYDGKRLFVRLSGTEKSVQAAARKLGGQQFSEASMFWRDLREQTIDFFKNSGDLWRISVAPAFKDLRLGGQWFYDWGGALRWLITDEPAQRVFSVVAKAEGHAQLFHSKNPYGEIFQPLPETLQKLNYNLKQAFDPAGIFNRGKMYAAW